MRLSLTVDYQSALKQLVNSFDRVVNPGVDAAKGPLVSEVAKRTTERRGALRSVWPVARSREAYSVNNGPADTSPMNRVSGKTGPGATTPSGLIQAVIAASTSSMRQRTRRVASSSSDTETASRRRCSKGLCA